MSGELTPAARALCERIGYQFRNSALLAEALTHASDSTAARGASYERLEFLGDRVLALVVAEMLYRRFPAAKEGELNWRLIALVRLETCAAVARDVGLGEALRFARQKKPQELAGNLNILGDACEALIAALYLDGGMEAARAFIATRWGARMEEQGPARRDPKSSLQEWAAAKNFAVPDYEQIARSGPDHDPLFRMRVTIKGLAPAEAEGRTKAEASQHAAEILLRREGAWTE